MITRNNYEEFFLLYVDGELSTAENLAVEEFVAQNPDLKEELETLLQCRITPDEAPVFTGKDQLLKHLTPVTAPDPASAIDIHNYESFFLSYIDGELDEHTRQAVADFARRHPEKGIELQQLQRTVNTPDLSIVFPGKEGLYRKEEKRKIAWLPFVRIAAAALIIGAIGLLIFRAVHTTENGPVIVKAGPATPTGQDAGHSIAAPATPSPVISVPAPSEEKLAAITKKVPVTVTRRQPDTLHLQKNEQHDNEEQGTNREMIAKVDPPQSDRTPDRDDRTPDRVKVRPVDDDPIVGNRSGTAPADHLAVLDPKASAQTTNASATATVTGSFATQALLNRSVAYNEDEPIEESAPKKNKLRGIFRKVTRALEKPSSRAEDEDRKVLIGGFQFALK